MFAMSAWCLPDDYVCQQWVDGGAFDEFSRRVSSGAFTTFLLPTLTPLYSWQYSSVERNHEWPPLCVVVLYEVRGVDLTSDLFLRASIGITIIFLMFELILHWIQRCLEAGEFKIRFTKIFRNIHRFPRFRLIRKSYPLVFNTRTSNFSTFFAPREEQKGGSCCHAKQNAASPQQAIQSEPPTNNIHHVKHNHQHNTLEVTDLSFWQDNSVSTLRDRILGLSMIK